MASNPHVLIQHHRPIRRRGRVWRAFKAALVVAGLIVAGCAVADAAVLLIVHLITRLGA